MVSTAGPVVVSPTSTALTDEAGETRRNRTGYSERELVVGVAFAIAAAHLALRAWMLWPSWFYLDDYALVGEAGASGLSGRQLVDPYAGQFMPLGRLVAWVVADSGSLSWHAAALSLLVMVAVADLACAWMLLELFGRRWGVLLPLAAYVSSAMVMPATMWWAAALNQLPLQAVLFAAVAAWVRYLRTGHSRWWVVVALVLGVGFLAYVKTLLVLVVLAWITLAHFSSGGLFRRVRDVVRRRWLGLATLAAGGAAFLVWYLAYVPSIVADGDRNPVALDLAGTMLGQALPTGLLGGPWRWWTPNPPVALADPPAWAVVLTWVVLVAVVVGIALRRRRTGRVWTLLALYVGLAYLLVLTTRAPLVGGVVGLEYRYLTDVLPVATLCIGLATMSLRGAVEPTEARPRPRLRLPASSVSAARLPLVAGAALAVSGVFSSVGYAHVWHTDHPSHAWFDQVRADLGGRGVVDVAEDAVPEGVVSGLLTPWNTTGRLLPLTGLEVSFPPVSTRVAYVDDEGHVTQGFVDPVVDGVPSPRAGCGYKLGVDIASSLTVPLQQVIPAGVFWVRVAYLTSAADTLTVTAGGVTGDVQVNKGLGSIFVNIAGGAAGVTLSVAGDATVCVGEVHAGPLQEGPAW